MLGQNFCMSSIFAIVNDTCFFPSVISMKKNSEIKNNLISRYFLVVHIYFNQCLCKLLKIKRFPILFAVVHFFLNTPVSLFRKCTYSRHRLCSFASIQLERYFFAVSSCPDTVSLSIICMCLMYS